jgi:hypothetical protein
LATLRMRSVEPIDVPPYLCTRSAMKKNSRKAPVGVTPRAQEAERSAAF